MDQLFAPWRMAYIQSAQTGSDECIFCSYPQEDRDEERHILARGDHCFVLLNLFPYNPGHLMVAPYRHVAAYEDLNADELVEMHVLVQAWIRVLRQVMAPQGFNLGVNVGKIAGAGFDGHVHFHVVPRWNGDMNFMPVLGETRVIPESIDATWKKLREGWAL